jgi:hypothetical protein
MAAIIRSWKRWVAAGCVHSTYACKPAQDVVLGFVERYKPHRRIDLGDVFDFTAIRTNASLKDECTPLDFNGGAEWFTRFRPTDWLQGNHDARIYELLDDPRAVVARLAGYVVEDIRQLTDKHKTRIVPYDVEDGWLKLGDLCLGHGFMYNAHALRDHVEMVGGNVCIAHLHHPHQYRGRGLGGFHGTCVGLLGDPKKLKYARRRRNTLSWAHGFAWGEYCDSEATIHLESWKCLHGQVESPRLTL